MRKRAILTMISIVIPIYNEEKNIDSLYDGIIASLAEKYNDFEIIFVNDGSTDASEEKLSRLAGHDQRVKVIMLRRNFGQTAALMAGFKHASGQIIVAMDGDQQNDPHDIPKLVDKIQEGYDVCSGWRQNRMDNKLTRRLPSRIANKLISCLSGVKLNDYGCTLKAYRKDILDGIKLYGEMHRFIPIYASWQGARITEIPVNHRHRKHGRSNYGMERLFKVFLDLLLVLFFSTLSNKPIYIFGGFGLLNIIFSFLTFFLMLYFKIWGGKTFIETPLPQLVIIFFLIGFISILMGFLAEIIMRTYYESQDKTVYNIKELINLKVK